MSVSFFRFRSPCLKSLDTLPDLVHNDSLKEVVVSRTKEDLFWNSHSLSFYAPSHGEVSSLSLTDCIRESAGRYGIHAGLSPCVFKPRLRARQAPIFLTWLFFTSSLLLPRFFLSLHRHYHRITNGLYLYIDIERRAQGNSLLLTISSIFFALQ